MALDRFKLLYEDLLVLDQSAMDNLAMNSHLTTEQIDLLYDRGANKDYLSQYPKLTDEQFMRFFNDESFNNTKLAENPHLTTEQIDLLYDARAGLNNILAIYSKLTNAQFMRLFDEISQDYLAMNSHLTTEQIDLLYDAGVKKEYLAADSKLTDEQFMRFFNDEDFDKDYLAENPYLTTEQIDLLYEIANKKGGFANVNLKENLAQYSKLTDGQFRRFFYDESLDFEDLLAQNDHLTTEQIDLLYETEGVNKDNLASYSKLTDEQFMRFFNDKDSDNTYLAQNPSINSLPNRQFASGIFNWKW